MSERLTEAELAEIRTALSGRTKYVGRRVPWDERLLAEVDALTRENTRLREVLASARITLGEEEDDDK